MDDVPGRIIQELNRTYRQYGNPLKDGGDLGVLEERARAYIRGFGLAALERNDWRTGFSAIDVLVPGGLSGIEALNPIWNIIYDELSK